MTSWGKHCTSDWYICWSHDQIWEWCLNGSTTGCRSAAEEKMVYLLYCGATLAQGIERIQNYGVRVITSSPPRTPSAELREKLQWTTLTDHRELFRLSTVHRYLHNNAARYMCSKFRTNSNLGYSHTRGYNNIHLEKPSTEYYRTVFWVPRSHQVEWTP